MHKEGKPHSFICLLFGTYPAVISAQRNLVWDRQMCSLSLCAYLFVI